MIDQQSEVLTGRVGELILDINMRREHLDGSLNRVMAPLGVGDEPALARRSDRDFSRRFPPRVGRCLNRAD